MVRVVIGIHIDVSSQGSLQAYKHQKNLRGLTSLPFTVFPI